MTPINRNRLSGDSPNAQAQGELTVEQRQFAEMMGETLAQQWQEIQAGHPKEFPISDGRAKKS